STERSLFGPLFLDSTAHCWPIHASQLAAAPVAQPAAGYVVVRRWWPRADRRGGLALAAVDVAGSSHRLARNEQPDGMACWAMAVVAGAARAVSWLCQPGDSFPP